MGGENEWDAFGVLRNDISVMKYFQSRRLRLCILFILVPLEDRLKLKLLLQLVSASVVGE